LANYLLLAKSYGADRLNRAELASRKAIELTEFRKNSGSAYFTLGMVLSHREQVEDIDNKIDEAKRCFRYVTQLNPEYADGFHAYGKLIFAKYPAQASLYLAEAARLDPKLLYITGNALATILADMKNRGVEEIADVVNDMRPTGEELTPPLPIDNAIAFAISEQLFLKAGKFHFFGGGTSPDTNEQEKTIRVFTVEEAKEFAINEKGSVLICSDPSVVHMVVHRIASKFGSTIEYKLNLGLKKGLMYVLNNLVLNAIKDGNQNDKRKNIRIDWQIEDGELKLDVTDEDDREIPWDVDLNEDIRTIKFDIANRFIIEPVQDGSHNKIGTRYTVVMVGKQKWLESTKSEIKRLETLGRKRIIVWIKDPLGKPRTKRYPIGSQWLRDDIEEQMVYFDPVDKRFYFLVGIMRGRTSPSDNRRRGFTNPISIVLIAAAAFMIPIAANYWSKITGFIENLMNYFVSSSTIGLPPPGEEIAIGASSSTLTFSNTTITNLWQDTYDSLSNIIKEKPELLVIALSALLVLFVARRFIREIIEYAVKIILGTVAVARSAFRIVLGIVAMVGSIFKIILRTAIIMGVIALIVYFAYYNIPEVAKIIDELLQYVPIKLSTNITLFSSDSLKKILILPAILSIFAVFTMFASRGKRDVQSGKHKVPQERVYKYEGTLKELNRIVTSFDTAPDKETITRVTVALVRLVQRAPEFTQQAWEKYSKLNVSPETKTRVDQVIRTVVSSTGKALSPGKKGKPSSNKSPNARNKGITNTTLIVLAGGIGLILAALALSQSPQIVGFIGSLMHWFAAKDVINSLPWAVVAVVAVGALLTSIFAVGAGNPALQALAEKTKKKEVVERTGDNKSYLLSFPKLPYVINVKEFFNDLKSMGIKDLLGVRLIKRESRMEVIAVLKGRGKNIEREIKLDMLVLNKRGHLTNVVFDRKAKKPVVFLSDAFEAQGKLSIESSPTFPSLKIKHSIEALAKYFRSQEESGTNGEGIDRILTQFTNAFTPPVDNFNELPSWVRGHLDALNNAANLKKLCFVLSSYLNLVNNTPKQRATNIAVMHIIAYRVLSMTNSLLYKDGHPEALQEVLLPLARTVAKILDYKGEHKETLNELLEYFARYIPNELVFQPIDKKKRWYSSKEPELGSYLDEINKFPVLTALGEAKFGILARLGYKDAERELAKGTMKFALSEMWKLLKEHKPYAGSVQDLVGVCYLAVGEKAQEYEPQKGYRFDNYCGYLVRLYVRDEIFFARNGIVRKPPWLHPAIGKLQESRAALQAGSMENLNWDRLSAKETAEYLPGKQSPVTTATVMNAMRLSGLSIDVTEDDTDKDIARKQMIQPTTLARESKGAEENELYIKIKQALDAAVKEYFVHSMQIVHPLWKRQIIYETRILPMLEALFGEEVIMLGQEQVAQDLEMSRANVSFIEKDLFKIFMKVVTKILFKDILAEEPTPRFVTDHIDSEEKSLRKSISKEMREFFALLDGVYEEKDVRDFSDIVGNTLMGLDAVSIESLADKRGILTPGQAKAILDRNLDEFDTKKLVKKVIEILGDYEKNHISKRVQKELLKYFITMEDIEKLQRKFPSRRLQEILLACVYYPENPSALLQLYKLVPDKEIKPQQGVRRIFVKFFRDAVRAAGKVAVISIVLMSIGATGTQTLNMFGFGLFGLALLLFSFGFLVDGGTLGAVQPDQKQASKPTKKDIVERIGDNNKCYLSFPKPAYRINIKSYFNDLKKLGIKNLWKIKLIRRKGRIKVLAVIKGKGKNQKEIQIDMLMLDDAGYPKKVVFNKKARAPTIDLKVAFEAQGKISMEPTSKFSGREIARCIKVLTKSEDKEAKKAIVAQFTDTFNVSPTNLKKLCLVLSSYLDFNTKSRPQLATNIAVMNIMIYGIPKIARKLIRGVEKSPRALSQVLLPLTKETAGILDYEGHDKALLTKMVGRFLRAIPKKLLSFHREPDYILYTRKQPDLGPYLEEIGKLPMLTALGEAKFSILAALGNESAGDELVNGTTRFAVASMLMNAANYLRTNVSIEDLIGECLIALRKAVKNYDPRSNTRFISYCEPQIRAHLSRKVSSDRTDRMVMARTSNDKIKQFRKACLEEFGTEDAVGLGLRPEEIASRIGWDLKKVTKILIVMGHEKASLSSHGSKDASFDTRVDIASAGKRRSHPSQSVRMAASQLYEVIASRMQEAQQREQDVYVPATGPSKRVWTMEFMYRIIPLLEILRLGYISESRESLGSLGDYLHMTGMGLAFVEKRQERLLFEIIVDVLGQDLTQGTSIPRFREKYLDLKERAYARKLAKTIHASFLNLDGVFDPQEKIDLSSVISNGLVVLDDESINSLVDRKILTASEAMALCRRETDFDVSKLTKKSIAMLESYRKHNIPSKTQKALLSNFFTMEEIRALQKRCSFDPPNPRPLWEILLACVLYPKDPAKLLTLHTFSPRDRASRKKNEPVKTGVRRFTSFSRVHAVAKLLIIGIVLLSIGAYPSSWYLQAAAAGFIGLAFVLFSLSFFADKPGPLSKRKVGNRIHNILKAVRKLGHDKEKQLALLLEAHKLDETNITVISYLPRINEELGKYKEAKKWALRYIQMCEEQQAAKKNMFSVRKLALAHNMLASIYLSQNKLQEALEESNKAINFGTNSVRIWYTRSSIYLALRKPEEALEAAERSIAIDPKYGFNWFHKSNALFHKGIKIAMLKGRDAALEFARKLLQDDDKDRYYDILNKWLWDMVNNGGKTFNSPKVITLGTLNHILERHTDLLKSDAPNNDYHSYFPKEFNREEIIELLNASLQSCRPMTDFPLGEKLNWWDRNRFASYVEYKGSIYRLEIISDEKGNVTTIYPTFGKGVFFRKGMAAPVVKTGFLFSRPPMLWNRSDERPIEILRGSNKWGFELIFNSDLMAPLEPIDRERLMLLAAVEGTLCAEDKKNHYYAYDIPLDEWSGELKVQTIYLQVSKKTYMLGNILELIPSDSTPLAASIKESINVTTFAPGNPPELTGDLEDWLQRARGSSRLKPDSVCFQASAGTSGEVIGIAIANEVGDFTDENPLNNPWDRDLNPKLDFAMYVRGDTRLRGVGSALCDALMNHAEENGYKLIGGVKRCGGEAWQLIKFLEDKRGFTIADLLGKDDQKVAWKKLSTVGNVSEEVPAPRSEGDDTKPVGSCRPLILLVTLIGIGGILVAYMFLQWPQIIELFNSSENAGGFLAGAPIFGVAWKRKGKTDHAPVAGKEIREHIKNLKNPDHFIQLYNIRALGNIGEQAAKAVPVLIRTMQTEDENIRISVVIALARIGESIEDGSEKKKIVRTLINTLEDDEKEVARAAVTALGMVGRSAKTSVLQEKILDPLTDLIGNRVYQHLNIDALKASNGIIQELIKSGRPTSDLLPIIAKYYKIISIRRDEKGLVDEAEVNFGLISKKVLDELGSLNLPLPSFDIPELSQEFSEFSNLEELLKEVGATTSDIKRKGFFQSKKGTDTLPVTDSKDFVSTYRIELKDGRNIYIKYLKDKKDSTLNMLLNEAYFMKRLKKEGLQSLPYPLMEDEHYIFSLNPKNLGLERIPKGLDERCLAIAYLDTDNSYFEYINDSYRQSYAEVRENLLARVKELASLTRKGIIHTAIIPAYHTYSRRYEWYHARPGKFTDWSLSCANPNISQKSLRDLEHINLRGELSALELQHCIGDHLLQLTLLLGSYFREATDNDYRKNFWGFTYLLREVFHTYYETFTGSDPSVLDKCIDWKDLGKKLSQDMRVDRYENEAVDGTYEGGDLGYDSGAFPVQELIRALHITSLGCVIEVRYPDKKATPTSHNKAMFNVPLTALSGVGVALAVLMIIFWPQIIELFNSSESTNAVLAGVPFVPIVVSRKKGKVIDVQAGNAFQVKFHPKFLAPDYKIGLQRYFTYLKERGFKDLLGVELVREMTKKKGKIEVTAVIKGKGGAAKEQRIPTGDVLYLDEKGYPINVTLNKHRKEPNFCLAAALEEQGCPIELVVKESKGNGWYFSIRNSVLLCSIGSFIRWYESEKGERLDPNNLSITQYAGHADNPRIEISKKGKKTKPLAVMEMKKDGYPKKLAKVKRGFTLLDALQHQYPEIYGEVSPKTKELIRGQQDGFTWTPIYYTFLNNFFKHLDTLNLGKVKAIIVREVDDVRNIDGQKSKGYLLKFSAVIEDDDGNVNEKQLENYEIPLDEHRRPRVVSSAKARKFSIMNLFGLRLPRADNGVRKKKPTKAKTAGSSKKSASDKTVKVHKTAAPSKPAGKAQQNTPKRQQKSASDKVVKVPKTTAPSKPAGKAQQDTPKRQQKNTSNKAAKVPQAAAPSKPAGKSQQDALKRQLAKEEQERKAREEKERKAREERERKEALERLSELENELIQWMEGVNIALDEVLLNGYEIEQKIHSWKSEAEDLKEKVNLAIKEYKELHKNLKNKDLILALRNLKSPRAQLAELVRFVSNLDIALNNMDLSYTWDEVLAGYIDGGYPEKADDFGEKELVTELSKNNAMMMTSRTRMLAHKLVGTNEFLGGFFAAIWEVSKVIISQISQKRFDAYIDEHNPQSPEDRTRRVIGLKIIHGSMQAAFFIHLAFFLKYGKITDVVGWSEIILGVALCVFWAAFFAFININIIMHYFWNCLVVPLGDAFGLDMPRLSIKSTGQSKIFIETEEEAREIFERAIKRGAKSFPSWRKEHPGEISLIEDRLLSQIFKSVLNSLKMARADNIANALIKAEGDLDAVARKFKKTVKDLQTEIYRLRKKSTKLAKAFRLARPGAHRRIINSRRAFIILPIISTILSMASIGYALTSNSSAVMTIILCLLPFVLIRFFSFARNNQSEVVTTDAEVSDLDESPREKLIDVRGKYDDTKAYKRAYKRLLGLKIKTYRDEFNLSQAQFGERFDVSQQAVDDWELGITMPSHLIMRQIAEFCGTDTVEFMTDLSKEELLAIRTNDSKNPAHRRLLGFKIMILRYEVELSPAEVTRMCAFSNSRLSQLETGTHFPNPGDMRQLTGVLSITEPVLLGEERYVDVTGVPTNEEPQVSPNESQGMELSSLDSSSEVKPLDMRKLEAPISSVTECIEGNEALEKAAPEFQQKIVDGLESAIRDLRKVAADMKNGGYDLDRLREIEIRVWKIWNDLSDENMKGTVSLSKYVKIFARAISMQMIPASLKRIAHEPQIYGGNASWELIEAFNKVVNDFYGVSYTHVMMYMREMLPEKKVKLIEHKLCRSRSAEGAKEAWYALNEALLDFHLQATMATLDIDVKYIDGIRFWDSMLGNVVYLGVSSSAPMSVIMDTSKPSKVAEQLNNEFGLYGFNASAESNGAVLLDFGGRTATIDSPLTADKFQNAFQELLQFEKKMPDEDVSKTSELEKFVEGFDNFKGFSDDFICTLISLCIKKKDVTLIFSKSTKGIKAVREFIKTLKRLKQNPTFKNLFEGIAYCIEDPKEINKRKGEAIERGDQVFIFAPSTDMVSSAEGRGDIKVADFSMKQEKNVKVVLIDEEEYGEGFYHPIVHIADIAFLEFVFEKPIKEILDMFESLKIDGEKINLDLKTIKNDDIGRLTLKIISIIEEYRGQSSRYNELRELILQSA